MFSVSRDTPLLNEVVVPLAKTVLVRCIKMAVDFVYYAASSRLGAALLLFTTVYGLFGVIGKFPTRLSELFVFWYFVLLVFITLSVLALLYYKPLRDLAYDRLGKDYIISRVGE